MSDPQPADGPLLQVADLRLEIAMRRREKRAILRGVSFGISSGEALGLVGESGSGKSMTARAVTGLLPSGATASGTVSFDGTPVLEMPAARLRRLRSHEMAMIFQDPRAHINPVHTVGDFLTEGLIATRGTGRGEARDVVSRLLNEVGIPDAGRRMRQHPHELSGGLLQRVMIAAALAGGPRLLLADEPTTALDVTTQEEVMAILDAQRRQRGLALLFITHDLELAAAVCDRIAVMYAGRIVEVAPAAALHSDPRHPYTRALLAARPAAAERGARLVTVPGRPVSAWEAGTGCAFAPRCPLAVPRCETDPDLRAVGDSVVACHRAEENVPGTAVRSAGAAS
jgi:oligopeptide/dipeptide ABC transporter ATP-binding protein